MGRVNCKMAGGGISFPDEIVAGDTPVFLLNHHTYAASTSWGQGTNPKVVEIKKDGIYRFKFNVRHGMVDTDASTEARLSKNGVEVPDSFMTASFPSSLYFVGSIKTIDITASTGDIIAIQLRVSTSSRRSSNDYLAASILAPDVQEAIDTIIERDV